MVVFVNRSAREVGRVPTLWRLSVKRFCSSFPRIFTNWALLSTSLRKLQRLGSFAAVLLIQLSLTGIVIADLGPAGVVHFGLVWKLLNMAGVEGVIALAVAFFHELELGTSVDVGSVSENRLRFAFPRKLASSSSGAAAPECKPVCSRAFSWFVLIGIGINRADCDRQINKSDLLQGGSRGRKSGFSKFKRSFILKIKVQELAFEPDFPRNQS